jgi:hypothetical protein
MNSSTPLQGATSRFGDKARLLGLALVICVGGVGCFLLADKYHIDPFWVFAALNSFWLIAFAVRRHPDAARTRTGMAFLGAWTLLHGLIAAILIARTVALVLWLPIFAIEFFLGFSVMRRIQPRSD